MKAVTTFTQTHIYLYTYILNISLILIFFTMVYLGNLSPVHAQILTDETASISISPNPMYPEPDSIASVTLDDYSVSAIGATIYWYINGVEQTSYKNARSIEVPTGKLGSKKTVSVKLVYPNGITLTAEHILEPTIIDIILEANTYVPHFYEGRALPSTQASVRAIAVVHTGKATTPSSYSYKWTLDDEVILGGVAKAQSAINFSVPRFGVGELELEVFDAEGKRIGKGSTPVHITEPVVYFYEHSPLRGLQKEALGSQSVLSSTETTIFAEPYFFNTPILTHNSIEALWKLNKTKFGSDATYPNAITLTKGKSSMETRVIFTASTQSNTPQYVEASTMITF